MVVIMCVGVCVPSWLPDFNVNKSIFWFSNRKRKYFCSLTGVDLQIAGNNVSVVKIHVEGKLKGNNFSWGGGWSESFATLVFNKRNL